MAAKLTTKSVLNHLTASPISYEVGETSALRRSITDRKMATAISPSKDAKKPIPAVKRAQGAGRTF